MKETNIELKVEKYTGTDYMELRGCKSEIK